MCWFGLGFGCLFWFCSVYLWWVLGWGVVLGGILWFSVLDRVGIIQAVVVWYVW